MKLTRLQRIAQLFTNALVRKRSEERLAFRRRFETLATDISAHFVKLPADRIDAEIENAQQRICECLDVDLSALWQWSKSTPHFAEDEALNYDSFDQRIDPEDRRRVEQEVQTAIQSNEPLDTEFRLTFPDGGTRWIKACGKRLPGAHGQAIRLMGASIDISRHREMEDQLRIQLKEINDLKQQVACTDATVLIEGETGTGKENSWPGPCTD